VFSVGAAPSLYNEDLRQLEFELRGSPELAVGRIENDKKLITLCKDDFTVCCSYRETYKSVARIRLVKNEMT
jgi:hypothetical protein